MKKEAVTGFAIGLLDEIADECERRTCTEQGKKQEVLADIADRLPKVMAKLVEEDSQIELDPHDE
jgi:hypothetical protein